jgi:feruloyl esterase
MEEMRMTTLKRCDTVGRRSPPLTAAVVGLGALAGGMLAAAPASASPPCTVAALSGLVHDVTVITATAVPAAGATPAFCQVSGNVKTRGFGAPDGTADFQFQLPENWNGKFLFVGVGGFAGLPSPTGISPNPVDFAEALPLGYATGTTDEGHLDTMPAGAPSSTDGSWAIDAPGVPDEARLADYFFRSTHEVTVAGKAFTRAFFGAPALKRSYYDGCSNGGRQAYVEATHFPEDFDGIIAGDPFLDIRSLVAGENFQKQQLTAETFIPFTLLPAIDAAVKASCDAVDGVTDGLIQNPAKCAFNPQSLGPAPGGSGLLSQGQVETLTAYISALRDDIGNVIYTGSSVSDIPSPPGSIDGADLWSTGFIIPDFAAAEPWGGNGFGGPGLALAPIGYQFVDHGIQYIVERDPTFNLRDFDAESPIGVISSAALRLFDERTAAGDGDIPITLVPFVLSRHKMLVYHGLSDPALNAFRTINNYLAVSRLVGGIDALRETMRLFLVPGMHHCGGGPGPNTFETLTALDNWVEHGIAPDSILATHFALNNPANGADRRMPLCAFPEEAQFSAASGATPINTTGTGWSCDPANQGMLQIGPNGEMAGVGQQNAPLGEAPFGIEIPGLR